MQRPYYERGIVKRATKFSTAGAALLVAGMSLSVPVSAQVTEVTRAPINDGARITFGYLCDDRFVIRNDGDKSVDLEYAIEKGNEHTKLQVGAHELVELNSKSRNAMELWMDGKLAAKAPKDKRRVLIPTIRQSFGYRYTSLAGAGNAAGR